MTDWTDALVALDACEEAVEWARTQPDYATAWATCERGDWMLWLAGRLAVSPAANAAYAAAVDAGVTYAAARARVLRQCADLMRRHYPLPPALDEVTR